MKLWIAYMFTRFKNTLTSFMSYFVVKPQPTTTVLLISKDKQFLASETKGEKENTIIVSLEKTNTLYTKS